MNIETGDVRDFQIADGRAEDRFVERTESVCIRQGLLESEGEMFASTTRGECENGHSCCGRELGTIHSEQIG